MDKDDGASLFKDKEHLLRMAGIFGVGIGIFLLLQFFLVPKTFGIYGHYRAAAIGENAAKPILFGGHQSCAKCHQAVLDAQKDSKHATVHCEACHGPLAKHAADPAANKAPKVVAKQLCPVCHEANVAKPKGFPQQNTEEHSGGEACDTCHAPHAPKM